MSEPIHIKNESEENYVHVLLNSPSIGIMFNHNNITNSKRLTLRYDSDIKPSDKVVRVILEALLLWKIECEDTDNVEKVVWTKKSTPEDVVDLLYQLLDSV